MMKPSELKDYNTFDIIHTAKLYRAYVTKYSADCIDLDVYYVDYDGRSHREFSKRYRTAASALKKLERYFGGEPAVWNFRSPKSKEEC